MQPHRSTLSFQRCATLVLLAGSGFIAGCALQETASPAPLAMDAGIHGKAMGGQQPVSGATVELVKSGSTAGYGLSNHVGEILASTVSDANGNFSLPSYICPTPTTLTTIQARNGNPGLAAGTNNTAIYLMAVTGPCGQLSSSTFIDINEVTTVATAFALRAFLGFSVNTTHTWIVGQPGPVGYGLPPAMLTYNNLVDNSAGTSPGAHVPAGASIPTATINSIANALAACVNSAGPSSTQCVSLLSNLQGFYPDPAELNVMTVAVDIANSPAANVANIFGLTSATAPFQPSLTSAPTDFALPIRYTSGNLSSPQVGLDIDHSGNVWVATLGGTPATGTIEELSNDGSLLQTNFLHGIIHSPSGVAVKTHSDGIIVISSASGNAGITTADVDGSNVVTDHNVPLLPLGVAMEGSTIIFSDAIRNSVYVYKTSLGLGYQDQASESSGASNVAIDDQFQTYVTNTGSFHVDNFGVQLFNPDVQPKTDDVFIASIGLGGRIAFAERYDFSNSNRTTFTAWHTLAGSGLVEYWGQGDTVAKSGFTTPFQPVASGIRVDGLGNIWVGFLAGGAPGNARRTAVFKPNYTLYPGGSFLGGTYSAYLPFSADPVPDIGIDISGNVWLANGGTTGLIELVGAAAPLVTPISFATTNHLLSTRP